MKRAHIRIIYFAFGISIAAHFLIGPLVHFKFVDAAPEPKPGHIIIVHVIPPKPKPTKPPVPHKIVAQKAISKPARPNTPHLTNKDNKNVTATERQGKPGEVNPIGPIGPNVGPGPDVATAGPSLPPAPSPTPKPACSAPYLEAATIQKYAPEMPAMAKEQGLTGTAQVEVNLSAAGQVLGAKIYASTGSSVLDAAAVEAAKRTTYAPKVVDCDRVPGSYLFRVDFESN